MSQPSNALIVCATMFACVSATPLGRPVVPLEYITMHTSSGSTSAARPVARRGQQRLVLVAVRAVRGDLDDALDVGQLVADLVDHRSQFAADDQHLGARVVEHIVARRRPAGS